MLGISLIHPAVMTYIIHFRPSQEVRGCIHEIYYICNYAFFLALPFCFGWGRCSIFQNLRHGQMANLVGKPAETSAKVNK